MRSRSLDWIRDFDDSGPNGPTAFLNRPGCSKSCTSASMSIQTGLIAGGCDVQVESALVSFGDTEDLNSSEGANEASDWSECVVLE